MQPKSVFCAIVWMLVFASMAFAAPSGPPGGDDQNGTGPNGPMNYANVTISLIADYDAHTCALDVNYISSQQEINKLINITGAMPNASISEEDRQVLMMLNRSLAEGGGSFACQLFSNGSGAGSQDGGGSQGSGQGERPLIDANGTAKCSGAEQEGKPVPAQLMSAIAHFLEKNAPNSEPGQNLSSMLSPLCPFGLPYADVAVILIVDNGTRSCFLGINYSSRTGGFDKRLNITGAMPNASISAGRYQAILVLNSSLAASGGSFRCVLFSNGSAECRGKEGNAVPFPALALRDAGIGKGLNDPSLPGPNDTNGLGLLCPYGANATGHENETHDDGVHHGGNETNNSNGNAINLGNIENGTGNSSQNGSAGWNGTAGGNATHGNMTGQGTAKANATNATAAHTNATSNNSAANAPASAAGGLGANAMMLAAAIILLVLLLYALLRKRARKSPS